MSDEEETMYSQVSGWYGEYGRYVNKLRAFPLLHDGLKIVERRLLYSLYETARKEYKKAALVVGHCIGHLHPHGDGTTYGTLVQMVSNGLVDGQGNWGTTVGIHDQPAAAMRYTECMLNEETLKFAFEFLDYAPFEELEMDSEPVFLPVPIPICLMLKSYCQGIGFGYKTYIPSYTKQDLVKRLSWLLGYTKTEPVIKPVTDCVYGSSTEDFRALLVEGKGKLLYRGRLLVDNANKSVVIKSLPPNKTFKTILADFKEEIQIQKSVGFIDESTTETTVRLSILKRGHDLERFVSRINNLVTGTVTFQCNVCDTEGNVVSVGIDSLLMSTYNLYKTVVERMVSDKISKLQQEIDELETLTKIKLVLAKWLKAFPDDMTALVNGIFEDTQIDVLVIKAMLDKYTISRIMKLKTDTEDKQKEKDYYTDKLNNISLFVWERYKDLK